MTSRDKARSIPAWEKSQYPSKQLQPPQNDFLSIIPILFLFISCRVLFAPMSRKVT